LYEQLATTAIDDSSVTDNIFVGIEENVRQSMSTGLLCPTTTAQGAILCEAAILMTII
jgi:hypothetical protein